VVALGAAVVASRSAERAREDWTRLLYVAAEPWLVGAALVLAAGIALAAFLLWHRLRWAGLAASALAVVAALGCGLEGFERFSPRQSGKIPAERMRAAAAGLEARYYSVDIYDQGVPFYLGRPVRLVKYRDEFDLGLAAEPHKGLATFDDFAREWRLPGHAVAIMQPGHFHGFRLQGLPMQLVHEDPRRIVVRKP
jgi:hypothetical protein